MLIFFYCFSAFAQEEGINFLELAKMLIKDGQYVRAETTLKKIEDVDTSDRSVYESLWGVIELQNKNYEKSLSHFDRSVQLGIGSPEEIYLYQAEAALSLGHIKQGLSYIGNIKSKEFKQEAYYIILSELNWRNGDKLKAWKILDEGSLSPLYKNTLLKKKFYYLLEESLYQAAYGIASDLLSESSSFNDVLAMASQFRQKGEYSLSLQLLQTLHLLRPEKELVALEMAQNYLAKKESFSAALVLEEAARVNPSLSFEASELLRQVGKGYRARYLNMLIVDPEKRLKQKLSLYLEEDDFHSLKFMIPQLKKQNLLENQGIRYAVAYSLFRTGDFEKSVQYLNAIDKEGLFEKSIELKKEINACKESKWACREKI